MSYMIVYDKQFVKTSTGISAIVLHGDNNVWETNKRRARDWHCWALDMTKDELKEYFSKWHNESNEHFKTNGKWLDNDGLDRWVKNNIKNALPIEDVLLANPYVSFECFLSVTNSSIPYGQKGHWTIELKEFIRTTEKFENWIQKAKERIAGKTTEEYINVITSFSTENLKHTRTSKEITGKVIAKKGKRYVYEVKDNHWRTIGPEIEKAMIFENVEEAKRLCTGDGMTFINAEKALEKNKEKQYVIRIENHGSNIGYVASVTKSNIRRTSYSDSLSAKRYTEAEAKKQIEKLNKRCIGIGRGYNFIAEKISEEETN